MTAAEKTDNRLIIRQPDDWHVHLRDGAMLAAVVNYTARPFARAIVMPNLNPPVTTVAAAKAYRDRITAALEPGITFTPLMTCYLTDTTNPAISPAPPCTSTGDCLRDRGDRQRKNRPFGKLTLPKACATALPRMVR
jgi:hypothetical protein